MWDFENKLKKIMAQNLPVWGASLTEASHLVAKFTVDTGVDFLWIDTEHTFYGTEAVPMIPMMCRSKGCVPIIRVANLDPGLVKKALDTGAAGIMVPQVNDAREARLSVQYAKYPPEGSRGVSPIWPIFMDVPHDEYLPKANAETLVVVQIESPEGIRNTEAICEVEGVDVLFAGPMDLSASLGHIGEINHPTVRKFLEEFPIRVREGGKHAGITVGDREAAKTAFDQGYRFIVIGNILRFGLYGMKENLEQLRKLTQA